jgi:hypothetical protein
LHEVGHFPVRDGAAAGPSFSSGFATPIGIDSRAAAETFDKPGGLSSQVRQAGVVRRVLVGQMA